MPDVETVVRGLEYANTAYSTIKKVQKVYEIFCAIRSDVISYENYMEEYKTLERAHTKLSEKLAVESNSERRKVMTKAMKLIHYQMRRVSRIRKNKVPETTVKVVGTTAAGTGGAWVGAKAGAVIAGELGCIAGPPGAVVGGIIGGITGGILGGLGGKAIMDKIFD